jgi:hypothetical protein
VFDNTITRNSRKGVFWEKCGGSHIRDVFYDGMLILRGNTIKANATEMNGVDAGVSIISSKNALVENNVFGNHPTGHAGIYIREDPNRLEPVNPKPGFPLENITVRNNTMNGDRIIGCDLPGVNCS